MSAPELAGDIALHVLADLKAGRDPYRKDRHVTTTVKDHGAKTPLKPASPGDVYAQKVRAILAVLKQRERAWTAEVPLPPADESETWR